jgi:hypothetical protein
MNCQQAQALISSDLDGQLAPNERGELDAHLAACAACRELRSALRQQDEALQRAFAPRRQAAAALADRTINHLRATRLAARELEADPAAPPAGSRPRTTIRLPWVPMMFSAAAGFLIAALIFRPWQRADLPGSPIAAGPHRQQEPTQPQAPVPAIEQPATTASLAQLAYSGGTIEMLRPDAEQWQRMQTGEAIAAGTRVRTGPLGRCEFRTQEGSLVRLNTATELVFHTNRTLELAGGQIWTSVEEHEQPFEVRVPQAAATVTALGTKFDILSRAAEAVLTVLEGSTRVEGKGWQEIVEHGQRAKIVEGTIAETSPVRNLLVATSWVYEILKMKGPENPELAEVMNDLFAQIGEGKMQYMAEKEILQLGDHCVLPLTRFIQSERSRDDQARRVGAARILAKIAQPWSVPDLIDLLGDREGHVRYHAAKALERLTDGVTHGVSADQWRDWPADQREPVMQRWRTWWEQNQEQFPRNPYAMPAGSP